MFFRLLMTAATATEEVPMGHSTAAATQPLRFGLCTDQNVPWATLRDQWRRFEALGFDSAWVCDHYQQPSKPAGPYFEGWTLLAALAAETTRIRLGVLVTSNTFRHPPLLAKEAVTVDHISHGRLELGIGAGWYEPEHAAYGIDFPPPGELVGRFREAVELIDQLLRQDVTTYAGTYYQVREAPFRPRPVQQPRPPLTLGAHRPKMLSIVAEYADRWNSHGTAAEISERNRILDEHCAAVGRDPSAIIRSLYGWASKLGADPWSSTDAFRDVIGRYQEAGISEFLIDVPPPDRFDVLEQVAADVVGGREPAAGGT